MNIFDLLEKNNIAIVAKADLKNKRFEICLLYTSDAADE